MKIQLASDLHLEYLQRNFPGERLITPAPGADLLVLAGDIANGTQAIDLFRNWPVPVLYVPGNHEFYEQSIDEARAALREAAKGNGVHLLDNDAIEFGNVRFLGATMWTDYLMASTFSRTQLMDNAAQKLKDHQVIRCGDGLFTPEMALERHEHARRWLAAELHKPFEGKTVVVTHHAPHVLSVHPRFAGDPMNASFISGGIDGLIAKADLWLHGHVHDSFDYQAFGCRIVANPRGYAQNRNLVASPLELRFENPAFEWSCVLEV